MSDKLIVRKSVKLDADVSKVWRALTDPEITKQYFFNCKTISDWQVGSPIEFKTSTDGKEIVAVKGVITAIEPEKKLCYTCFTPQFEDMPEKHTTVNLELTRDGDTTTLSISQGPFKDEEAYIHTQGGWDSVLGGLKQVVEK